MSPPGAGRARALAYGALGACVALVVGAFGTWIDQSLTLGSVSLERSLSGTSGGRDGVVVIVLALIAAALVAAGLRGGARALWPPITAGILGLLALATVVADIADIADKRTLSAGWGIWLDLMAALALVALCTLLAFAARAAAAAGPPAAPAAPASAAAMPVGGPAPGQAPAPLPDAPAATVPAGWYGDPSGSYRLRWWDGTAWTDHTSA